MVGRKVAPATRTFVQIRNLSSCKLWISSSLCRDPSRRNKLQIMPGCSWGTYDREKLSFADRHFFSSLVFFERRLHCLSRHLGPYPTQLRVTFKILYLQNLYLTSCKVHELCSWTSWPANKSSSSHWHCETHGSPPSRPYNFPRVKKRLRRSANDEGRPVRLWNTLRSL